MRPPAPETRVVLLASAGYPHSPREVITIHTFDRTKPCVVPGPRGNAHEFIFKCAVTGAERRWGCEDRR